MLLRRCGLVWNLRLPEQLPPRPELMPVDPVGLPTQGAMALGAMRSITLPLFAHLVFGPETKRQEASLRWPASLAPQGLLRALCGHRVNLVLDRRAPRMALRYAGHELLGMPALMAAIGRRHTVLGLITLCLLPLMLTVEKLRSALSS
jgi:stearoyl-CoA desaturase (delta-9 desaturase)